MGILPMVQFFSILAHLRACVIRKARERAMFREDKITINNQWILGLVKALSRERARAMGGGGDGVRHQTG